MKYKNDFNFPTISSNGKLYVAIKELWSSLLSTWDIKVPEGVSFAALTLST